MDAWEIGSLIACLSINFGVAWQLLHIIKAKSSAGISLLSWFSFTITLSYMSLFSFIKGQHTIIIINYGVSTLLHGLTALAALKYRGKRT